MLLATGPSTLLKRDSNTGAFLEICDFFKNTYFEEHIQTTAPGLIPALSDHTCKSEMILEEHKASHEQNCVSFFQTPGIPLPS